MKRYALAAHSKYSLDSGAGEGCRAPTPTTQSHGISGIEKTHYYCRKATDENVIWRYFI